jgi:hypothetical protein
MSIPAPPPPPGWTPPTPEEAAKERMDRWSLSNRFSDISYEQFMNLTDTFQRAAERAYGTPTIAEVRVMKATRMSVSIPDPMTIQYLRDETEKNTTLKTDNPNDVTKDIWDRAVYVEVNIRPVQETEKLRSAFAQVSFKGRLPQQATFYIQGDDVRGVKEETLRNRPRFSKVGDGYTGNSHRSLR